MLQFYSDNEEVSKISHRSPKTQRKHFIPFNLGIKYSSDLCYVQIALFLLAMTLAAQFGRINNH